MLSHRRDAAPGLQVGDRRSPCSLVEKRPQSDSGREEALGLEMGEKRHPQIQEKEVVVPGAQVKTHKTP